MFLAVGIVLGGFLGLGFFLWLINKFAEFALPFFAAMTVFLAEYHRGIGVGTAFLAGILVAGVTFGIWRFAYRAVQTPILRAAIALPFALGSAVAGYFVGSGMSQAVISSHNWCVVLGVLSALTVGSAAWRRLATNESSTPRQNVSGSTDQIGSIAA